MICLEKNNQIKNMMNISQFCHLTVLYFNHDLWSSRRSSHKNIRYQNIFCLLRLICIHKYRYFSSSLEIENYGRLFFFQANPTQRVLPYSLIIIMKAEIYKRQITEDYMYYYYTCIYHNYCYILQYTRTGDQLLGWIRQ